MMRRSRGCGFAAAVITTSLIFLAQASGPPALANEAARPGDEAAPTQRPQLPPTQVQPGETQGVTQAGEPGITETVAVIMERQRERDAAGLKRPFRLKRERRMPTRTGDNPLAPAVSQWPPAPEGAVREPLPRNPQIIGANFLGIQLSEASAIPPDSMGDVGPTQVLVAANGRIKVFSKAGVLGGLNAEMDTFFSSVGGTTNGTSDPHVRYDRLSGRWFITIISINNCPNDVLIAVSSGSTISSSSSFTFFKFAAPASRFADYDTLGVDKNALYIGVNKFVCSNALFENTTAFVVRKSALLSGSLVVTTFDNLIGGTTGLLTPQGVQNDDPGATE